MSLSTRLIAAVLCALPWPALADLAVQRAAFAEALPAAMRGDAATVARHRDALADYPLYPYVEYYLLGNSFDRAPPGAVREFVERWPDLPLNARLQYDWLVSLARRGRWEQYLQEWDGHSPHTVLRCYWVTAHIRTGAADAPRVRDEAVSLWLVGRSQPDACDPVFAWMERAGHLTPALVQQRMELALAENQYTRAAWLARRLDDADRDFVQRWQAMQRSPARALAAGASASDTARERRLLLAGLERLARIDPALARRHLEALRQHHRFDAGDPERVLRIASLISAQRHEPQAVAWLAALDDGDFMVDEWRVRAALRHGQWEAVRSAIDRLPESVRGDDGWRYWYARALEHAGDEYTARAQLESLADGHGYHAWLAADRLGEPYRIRSETDADNEGVRAVLEARPAIQRARELLAIGMLREARAEWAGAIAGLDDDELVQAALLADRWQWHAQAIATLGRAGRLTDLVLRYPLLYEREIGTHARDQGIDPALVYSLVRSESLFVPDARSGVGALGLMQLMPGTGREVARRLGVRAPDNAALLDPDLNLRLGTGYLGQVLQRFDRNEVLATAAYNAGPRRVHHWLPRDGSIPADVWVETIPFQETRQYVRRVMGGAAIFDWRLGHEVRPLSTRMQDVQAVAD